MKTAHKKAVRNKSQTPLVSVIVPMHNVAEFIDGTIHSVLGQTYENWELILVDDASDDNTLEVVGQFSSEKMQVVRLKKSDGAEKARNRGVTAAKGRYICFLNAGDLWQPDKLARQLAFMKENGAAFSYAGYVYTDSDGRPKGKVVRVPDMISARQFASKGEVIYVSTVMFDTKKVGKRDVKGDNLAQIFGKVTEKVGEAHGLNEVMCIRRRQEKKSVLNAILSMGRVWGL